MGMHNAIKYEKTGNICIKKAKTEKYLILQVFFFQSEHCCLVQIGDWELKEIFKKCNNLFCLWSINSSTTHTWFCYFALFHQFQSNIECTNNLALYF